MFIKNLRLLTTLIYNFFKTFFYLLTHYELTEKIDRNLSD